MGLKTRRGEELEKMFLRNKNVLVSHKFLRENVKYIPDSIENSQIFERLAQAHEKEIRKALSNKKNLTKKTVTILGFMEKFTYYEENYN